jgi:hypothetical protein
MNSSNPFAVIDVAQPADAAGRSPHWFTIVDGRCIGCGRQVQLPPVCIHTGAVQQITPWITGVRFPAYRLILRQQQVQCQYYLHNSIGSRMRLLRRIGGLLTFAGLASLFAPVVFASSVAVIMAALGVPISLIGRLIASFAEPGLRIHRYGPDGTFVLRGIRKPFFDTLATIRRSPQ